MITTDINYPDGLPNPLRENHTLSAVQPFLRTGMASGRARQRRSFTSVPTMGTFDFLFKTDNQAAAFEAWFRDSLNDGAEWFNIQRKTPLGMVKLVCRFTSMYSGPTLVGRSMWRYSCPLEVWERPLMPEGWGEFPWFVIDASLFDIAMNREWPMFVFDFDTYIDAIAAFNTLHDGQVISVRDAGGMHAIYKVRRNTGPSLYMDFVQRRYFITDGPDGLVLIETWNQS